MVRIMGLPKSFETFVPSDEFTKEIEAACKSKKGEEVKEELEGFIVAEKYVKSDNVLANGIIPNTVTEIVLLQRKIKKAEVVNKGLPADYDYNRGMTYSTVICNYPIGENLVSRKISLQTCSMHKDDPVCIEIECERALERQRMFGKKEAEVEVRKKIKKKAEGEQGMFQAKVDPIQGDA
jgi:hypothetical protein